MRRRGGLGGGGLLGRGVWLGCDGGSEDGGSGDGESGCWRRSERSAGGGIGRRTERSARRKRRGAMNDNLRPNGRQDVGLGARRGSLSGLERIGDGATPFAVDAEEEVGDTSRGHYPVND